MKQKMLEKSAFLIFSSPFLLHFQAKMKQQLLQKSQKNSKNVFFAKWFPKFVDGRKCIPDDSGTSKKSSEAIFERMEPYKRHFQKSILELENEL